MNRFSRCIYVLPLIAATCAVAILNGGVLCMAGADHVAVEAKHDAGCCSGPRESAGHDDDDPHRGGCSDVSAELDLLRADARTSIDAGPFVAPCVWAVVPSGQGQLRFAVALPVASTSAPPSSDPRVIVESVVLII
jgi:hypothetical protein